MRDSEKHQQESRSGVTAFEPSRLVSFDRGTFLAEIKRVLQKLGAGRAPTHKEFNKISRVHSATIVKYFGTWEAAMRAAGVDYTRSRVLMSDLENDLRRVLAAADGKYFTQEFYIQAGGQYSVKTLKNGMRCSTWGELLEKVLLVSPVRRVIVKKARAPRPSMEELLGEFQRVSEELGRRPTYDEFRSRSRIGIKAFETQFGSWTGAVSALSTQNRSLAPWGKRTHCTPELLLAELRSTAAKTSNKSFSYADYRSLGGCYSIGTFQNRFGRWRDAVRLIGREEGLAHPRPHLTFTNEDYFAEMQRVWEILGRQPKSREMKQYGSKISHQAFQVRFGSWMRAVHAFCEDRGSTDDRSKASPLGEASEEESALPPLPSVDHEQRREHVAAGVLVIQKATPRTPALRLRFRVLQRDRFTCRACGRSPATESGVVLHVDHIVPYSGLGKTVFENLQTLCGRCNLGKSDSLPEFE
jgi:preprotein translocase subunit Sss1